MRCKAYCNILSTKSRLSTKNNMRRSRPGCNAEKEAEIRRDYRKAGFSERQGKGDHTVFSHPLVRHNYAVDGRDGFDAERYDERNLREALQELADAKRKSGQP